MRRLHNEKLNGVCSLPDIIVVITSRMMRVVGYVADTWESTGVYRVLYIYLVMYNSVNTA